MEVEGYLRTCRSRREGHEARSHQGGGSRRSGPTPGRC